MGVALPLVELAGPTERHPDGVQFVVVPDVDALVLGTHRYQCTGTARVTKREVADLALASGTAGVARALVAALAAGFQLSQQLRLVDAEHHRCGGLVYLALPAL